MAQIKHPAVPVPQISVEPGDSKENEDEAENDLDTEEPPTSYDVQHSQKEPEPPTTEALHPARPTHTDTSPMPVGEKASSASGEKIFDWDKHKGETLVPHPFSEKGLIRVTKDRAYLYKVDESPQDKAIVFQAGPFDPVNLRNPETDGPNASFAKNYAEGTAPAILITREWQLWRMAIGKFGLQVGTGFFVAQGHGHFVHLTDGKIPMETFTFIALPNSVGGVYRMQFTKHQMFVPYGGGGGLAYTFSEVRDDHKGPKFGGALAAYVDAGVAFDLTYFDYLTRIQLDREYGLHSIYLTVEYRRNIALSERYDFSGNYINGGLVMEY